MSSGIAFEGGGPLQGEPYHGGHGSRCYCRTQGPPSERARLGLRPVSSSLATGPPARAPCVSTPWEGSLSFPLEAKEWLPWQLGGGRAGGDGCGPPEPWVGLPEAPGVVSVCAAPWYLGRGYPSNFASGRRMLLGEPLFGIRFQQGCPRESAGVRTALGNGREVTAPSELLVHGRASRCSRRRGRSLSGYLKGDRPCSIRSADFE